MVAEELTRLPSITDVFEFYGQEDDIVRKSRDQLMVSWCMPGFWSRRTCLYLI